LNPAEKHDAAANSSACAQDNIGSKYVKCLYRGYKDGSFKKYTEQPEHLGILGPPIHAAVGDSIEVVFKVRTSDTVSDTIASDARMQALHLSRLGPEPPLALPPAG
jgi:hypothetical protein